MGGHKTKNQTHDKFVPIKARNNKLGNRIPPK